MAQKLLKTDKTSGYVGIQATDAINDNFTELYAGAGGGGALTINSQPDSYTLVLADAGKLIDMTKSSASNLTVPPNSDVAFPVGTVVTVKRSHATGAVTF